VLQEGDTRDFHLVDVDKHAHTFLQYLPEDGRCCGSYVLLLLLLCAYTAAAETDAAFFTCIVACVSAFGLRHRSPLKAP